MPERLRPRQLLAALVDSVEDAILVIRLDGTIEQWSRGAERLYGYTAEEMDGQALARLLPMYEIPALNAMLHIADDGKLPKCTGTASERVHKSGAKLRVSLKHTLVQDEEGMVTGILESGKPIGRIIGDAPEDAQLRQLIEQLPVMLWTTDQNLRITSSWGAGFKPQGSKRQEPRKETVFELLQCANRYATPIAEHYEALRGTLTHFEYENRNRVLEIHVQPLRGATGEITGCLGMAQDITDRKKSEEQILYQATHDALTGLANYRRFIDTLDREVRRAERSHHCFTVLLMDLDDLKRINDRFGHLAGNRALKRLATLMREHCRATDLAARYGGDEFGVVLIDSDWGMAEQVAGRIENGLRNDTEEPRLSVSIGIGAYPDDGRSSQELLEAADRRLYRRKKTARLQGATVT
jgi:diguanylate cyclase (GGDEF)-like protein/PAS domain S-box-containing protein